MRNQFQNLALAGILFASAWAAADEPTDSGALDPTFGVGGKVTIAPSVEAAGTSITGADLAVQPDGKILVLGHDNSDITFVVRLNANGSVDQTFGGTQEGLPAGFVGFCCGTPDGIAVRPNGRVVFAFHNAAGSAIYVAQFLADGNIDFSFGTSAGVSFAQPAPGDALYGGKMILDADGTIDIAGTYHQQSTNNNQFHFTRFAADGQSSQTFQFAFGSGNNQDDHALGVAVDRQGRYLVSGYHRGAAGNYDCAAIRITRDLYDVDRTFNYIDDQDYGSVTLAFDYGGDNFDSCNAVAVQDDYIILGGNSTKPTTGGTFQAATLALLDPNGALVQADCVNICIPAKFAFGYAQTNQDAINTVGKLIIDPYNTKYPNVYAIGSGRLGGSPHGPAFGIARMNLPQNTNFRFDPDFNSGSPLSAYFATRPDGIGLQITSNTAMSGALSNGKLVAVGSTQVGSISSIAVLRMAPFDGILRNGFDVPYY
ncbi:MAG: delta-60 repeat domain-containing protein [Rudaea sp.]